MTLLKSSLCVPLLYLATGQMAFSQTMPAEAYSTTSDAAEPSSEPSGHFEAAYAMASLSIGGVSLSPAVKQVMREQLLAGFAQDANFQSLELEFPGVTVAVVDVVLPIAVRQTEQTTPVLIKRLATLYAAEMTADEIAVATKWYSSPAFDRISATMESNMDLSQIILNSMVDTEHQISSEDLETIDQNSAAQSASAMELADKAALMRFSGTTAFAKLESLKPKSLMIQTEWTNEEDPDQDAEIETIMIKALEDFTGLDLSE